MPNVVVELSAEGTWREDLFAKRKLYAQLGVSEYFLVDPEAMYLRPALQGFRRMKHGIFEPLELDAEDRLYSEQLDLYLRAEGEMLRLIRANDEPVLTKDERIAQLEAQLRERDKGQAR